MSTQTDTRGQERIVLLTVTEVAELLRITTKAVYRMVDKRTIPFVKFGRSLRFELSAIQQLVHDNSHPALN